MEKMPFELPGMTKHTSEISDSVLNLSTNYCLTDIQLKYVNINNVT